MKNARLLDSFALIRFLRQERGYEQVKERLREAGRTQEPLLMCEMNLGEVYYVIGREEGVPKAEEILTSVSTLPIRRIPATWEIILQAARLKAQHPLSYADCIAAASAISQGAVLITGDKEFRTIQHLLPIEWV